MDQKFSQPLIISILAHTCLILILLFMPVPKPAPTLQTIHVVYQNEMPRHKRRQQIVSNVTPPTRELIKELRKKVDLLSRLTQRVLHEEIARRSGVKTINRDAAIPQPTRPDHYGQGPSITAPMNHTLNPNQLLGESTIADDIPDVRAGGFTALNTNQFVFYTFFSRINEQIGNRWVENVQNIIYRTPDNVINAWAHQDQITQVEIILTPLGKFVRAIVYHHADDPRIDEAAISAFRRASPFTNPPSALVSRDGYIHLLYGFHIYFRPRFLASDSSH